MSLELRPYQRELVDQVDAHFESGVLTVVASAPTGSGKTATSTAVICPRVQRGSRVLFLAQRDCLLEDTHVRLTEAGVWSSILQAGRPMQPLAPVQVCSVQTLHARGERPPADFIILDECHHALAPTLRALLEAYPSVPLLGLTATTQRGDGSPLGDVFQRLVVGPSVRWLTTQGYLVRADVIAPSAPIDGGLAMDPVAAWFEYTPGSRTIVFARSVQHARDITDRFVARGVSAECITAETSRAVRVGLRDRLTSGISRVLVSVGVFLEGFDAPCIETVLLARPFGVCGPYLQAIGRGLRPFMGKLYLTVIDLCGSVYLHGLPDDERVWSLEGDAVRRTGDALDPMRRCRACMAIFRPSSQCPRCGAETMAAPRVQRVLSRAERLELVNRLPLIDRDRRYLTKLEWIAEHRVHLRGDAAKRWALRKFIQQRKREPGKEAA